LEQNAHKKNGAVAIVAYCENIGPTSHLQIQPEKSYKNPKKITKYHTFELQNERILLGTNV